MSQSNDNHSNTTIPSLNYHRTSSNEQNHNRQINSNLSTQANASSQNDFRVNQNVGYGEPISDFNQIQEEKFQIGNYEDVGKGKKEGVGITQFELQQREEQLNEKMDIAQMDQNGKQTSKDTPFITQNNHQPTLQTQNNPSSQSNQPHIPPNPSSQQNQNRYKLFQFLNKTISQESSDHFQQQFDAGHLLQNSPQNPSNTKHLQSQKIHIIVSQPPQSQNQYSNIHYNTEQQLEPQEQHSSVSSPERKKVHFDVAIDNKQEIEVKQQLKQEQQQQSNNLKEQEPMQLQYINSHYTKQTNTKSQHSQPPKSQFNTSNHAQYATSADRHSINSSQIQHHHDPLMKKPIIRHKLNNHVSIQVDLSLSGKPTRKYKGNGNIFRGGKTTIKKVDMKKSQRKGEDDDYEGQNRQGNQMKFQQPSQKREMKSTKKMSERKIETSRQSDNKNSASKVLKRNLNKQLDPTLMQQNLGSKYTWVLRDRTKLPLSKRNSIKKIQKHNKNQHKSKQIIQKRTSQRLNPRQSQQTQNQSQSPSNKQKQSKNHKLKNDNSHDTSNRHSPSSSNTQQQSQQYSYNNDNSSSMFNIGKQSLRTRKINYQHQQHRQSSKNTKNKSSTKPPTSVSPLPFNNNKKSTKKSATKHSKHKNQDQEQIDINYIKTHIKEINVRSLRLENNYNALTNQDKLITDFLLEQCGQGQDGSDDQGVDGGEVEEEIKRQRIEQGQQGQADLHQNNNQNSPINQLNQEQSIINEPETVSVRRRITQQRQLTLQESFSKIPPKNPQKLNKYRPKQQPIKIKRVIDPNINNHGIYSLFQVTQRTQFFHKFKYALVPIVSNFSRVKKRHIDQDCQKARQLVGQGQSDNLAYIQITMTMLDMIDEQNKRRSQ